MCTHYHPSVRTFIITVPQWDFASLKEDKSQAESFSPPRLLPIFQLLSSILSKTQTT